MPHKGGVESPVTGKKRGQDGRTIKWKSAPLGTIRVEEPRSTRRSQKEQKNGVMQAQPRPRKRKISFRSSSEKPEVGEDSRHAREDAVNRGGKEEAKCAEIRSGPGSVPPRDKKHKGSTHLLVVLRRRGGVVCRGGLTTESTVQTSKVLSGSNGQHKIHRRKVVLPRNWGDPFVAP